MPRPWGGGLAPHGPTTALAERRVGGGRRPGPSPAGGGAGPVAGDGARPPARRPVQADRNLSCSLSGTLLLSKIQTAPEQS